MNRLRLITPLLAASSVAAEPPTASWQVQWQSKYVSEGRDNLAGAHYTTTTVDGGVGNFEAAALFGTQAESPRAGGQRYREWNLMTGYGSDIGPLDWRASYTRLGFPGTAEADSEWALELSTAALPIATPTLSYTWSDNAGGAFIELSVEQTLDCGDGCGFTPYALLGANTGFIPDGRRGMNNLQLGGTFSVETSQRLTLSAQANYSRPFAESEEEHLTELLWLNLSLHFRIH